MQRARITELGWEQDLRVESVEESRPLAGHEVRVAVEACGVCHRDLIDRAGRFKFIQLPITPGHEAVGRVVAAGPEVTEWKVGDRVATLHRDFCGSCSACLQGETSICTQAASVFGLLVDGGYATEIIAPERCFYRTTAELTAPEPLSRHSTVSPDSLADCLSLRRGDAGYKN